jgi:hypothetical protein
MCNQAQERNNSKGNIVLTPNEDATFSWLQVVDMTLDIVKIEAQVRPPVLGVIRNRDLEFGGLAGENGIDTRERYFQTDEISLALMH